MINGSATLLRAAESNTIIPSLISVGYPKAER